MTASQYFSNIISADLTTVVSDSLYEMCQHSDDLQNNQCSPDALCMDYKMVRE